MKRIVFVVLSALLAVSTLNAAAYMNANDLEPGRITSEVTYEDDVRLVGTDSKHMTVEEMQDAQEAPDGEIFNNRIKLEGSGNVNQRVVKFPANEGEVLVLYAHSSGDAVRTLALVNLDTGAEVAAINVPMKNDPVGISETEIPSDGDYALYSKGSGINIYCLICE